MVTRCLAVPTWAETHGHRGDGINNSCPSPPSKNTPVLGMGLGEQEVLLTMG
jgi:hypothetical protein